MRRTASFEGSSRRRTSRWTAAMALACAATSSSACGPASPPAKVAPFFVYDWRVVDLSGGGGATVALDIWKDVGPSIVPLTSADPDHEWSFSPAISPDGTTIAFIGKPVGTDETHVFTMRSNGFSLRQITFGRVHDLDPTWSPNGQRIAFSSDRIGTRSIWTCKPDGSSLWRVTTSPDGSTSGDLGPKYSPDGLRIVFQRAVGDQFDVYLTNAWIGTPTKLTKNFADDADPVFSPDGRKIAFASNRVDGEFRIFQMNVDGTGEVLTDPIPVGRAAENHFRPTWTGDGSRIWYVSRYEPGGIQGDQSIHSMKPDGTDDRFEEEMILDDELDHPDVHP